MVLAPRTKVLYCRSARVGRPTVPIGGFLPWDVWARRGTLTTQSDCRYTSLAIVKFLDPVYTTNSYQALLYCTPRRLLRFHIKVVGACESKGGGGFNPRRPPPSRHARSPLAGPAAAPPRTLTPLIFSYARPPSARATHPLPARRPKFRQRRGARIIQPAALVSARPSRRRPNK